VSTLTRALQATHPAHSASGSAVLNDKTLSLSRSARAADGNTPPALGCTPVVAPTQTTVSGQPRPRRKTLELAEWLGDAQGIDIAHNGHVYRLQITKAGKLILTK
jgi:hemin uptake protein HemP